MATTAHPLARLGYRLHLDLDDAYADLPDAVRAAVRRHARPGPAGVPVLDALGAVLVERDVRNLLLATIDAAATAIVTRAADAARLAEDELRGVAGG